MLRLGQARCVSMACPLVSGLASLIRGQIPGASPAEVKKRLEPTADRFGKTGFDPNGLAWGRVNAFESVKGNTIFSHLRGNEVAARR